MARVGTNPAPFLDWGGESRLVTSLSSPGPGWPGIGGMTEEYAKIGTALARGELARELVPISTEESTSEDNPSYQLQFFRFTCYFHKTIYRLLRTI